ncbi:MAG: hypothetical protein RR731_00990, partial [Oscillospiraceae bacterium]
MAKAEGLLFFCLELDIVDRNTVAWDRQCEHWQDPKHHFSFCEKRNGFLKFQREKSQGQGQGRNAASLHGAQAYA